MTTQRDTQPPAPTYLAGVHAGFASRFLALVIDIVVLMLTLLVGNTLWTTLLSAPPVQWLRDRLIAWLPGLEPWFALMGLWVPVTMGLVIVCGYFLFFFTITGQTVGKRVLGLQVIAAGGGRLSFVRAVVRLVGYVISAAPFYLGFLVALIDKRRRTWHDRLAGSVVVYAWDARPNEQYFERASRRLKR